MKDGLSKEDLFSPGLEGIPACHSKVCFIDGTAGILEYRDVRIEELAEHSTFEETSYLLLKGKFPKADEMNQFDWDLRRHRRLKFKLADIIKCLPEDGHPMGALQTAIAALGVFHPMKNVADPEENYHAMLRLIAKIPTIIATYHRVRNNLEPMIPKDELNHAANFLYMLTGQEPRERDAKMMDICLILHAEHGLNASTFSGRVTGSTLADPFAVIAAAIGTLSGPLHGGANEEVIDMFRQIGSADRVRPYIEERIAKKEKIMGLGHRVYKTKDPRAIILQKLARQLFADKQDDPLMAVAEEVEKVALEKLSAKGIYPNVDFYSGIVYNQLAIPGDLNTCLFAMARISGWLAHWLEQLDGNRLYRPTQIYEGSHQKPYPPIDQR
ncbi:MAG TPA: citrate synthase [Bdellovibrionota bacterium]|nr:citrate synthase [Bdellovibrionota bacterium]